MGEDLILNPHEVAQRRKAKPEIVNTPVKEKNLEKFYKKSGGVFVQFESQGRFDAPPEMGFKDFTAKDVNDILLSRRQDILQNVILMLDKNRIEQENMISVMDFTLEELLEVLVAIKKQFNTTQHKHLWMCQCNAEKPQAEQKINEMMIDLNTIRYRSITEADAEFKKSYAEDINSLSDEEWKDFINHYYKDTDKTVDNWTRQDEIDKIYIKEPIRLSDDNGDVYEFRLPRVKDIIEATKIANAEFNPKILEIQNRQSHGIKLADIQQSKQKEIDEIEYARDKAIMLYAKSLSLLKVNDKELSSKEKIDIYKELPRSFIIDYAVVLDQIKFGIYEEIELECKQCGTVNKESLRQGIDLLQLLPFNDDSDRNSRKFSRLNLSFGDGA